MPLSNDQKKRFRGIGHALKPIVTIGANGITDSVLEEVRRALHDHELIKVKLAAGERDDRQAIVDYIVTHTQCEEVTRIGKITLLYKANRQADPKLSNITRHSNT